MTNKLINNLITNNHIVPKPDMSLKQKTQIAVTIVTIVSLKLFLVWKFINYRKERQVTQFFHNLEQRRFDQAYAKWDADDHYKMKDFLDDFDADNYYTKNMQNPQMVT